MAQQLFLVIFIYNSSYIFKENKKIIGILPR